MSSNPDFKKTTVETIAKRAGYKCSNPDCRVNTIGPNTNPNKTTKIGEAAHIYGARQNSKRYEPKMTNIARKAITNAIWLCRNCHKLIDADEHKYTATLLFLWREKHEEFIFSTLGSKTEQMLFDQLNSDLREFEGYPPIIKRIIIDKPFAWEYRLTAELMRHLNKPIFRKLQDLRNGLYLKKIERVNEENAFNWVEERIQEMQRIIEPTPSLLNSLNQSFGESGEPGDEYEIHHITILFKKYFDFVVEFEERIHFISVPEGYKKIVSMLKNIVGSQIQKLFAIPDILDDIIAQNEKNEDKDKKQRVIKRAFVFDAPKNWSEDFVKEVNRLEKDRR